MPTVMRIGPFRFFFYSNEGSEPQHVHVQSSDGEAKFWLKPIEIAWSRGFNDRELSQIGRHIQDNQAYLLETWHKFFEV
ncbi:DUF4160 domain-containing protein [Aggregatilinea lenta]|jgi:hypothetical protein|uniref:DUF4160 domain-containing protein n=1 Tax=Aggregatilinea lenta TaxID=913108 RepID=UPI000E5B3562|nr:DUF4160 domain-containing protein [Aggregatilinea lenta]